MAANVDTDWAMAGQRGSATLGGGDGKARELYEARELALANSLGLAQEANDGRWWRCHLWLARAHWRAVAWWLWDMARLGEGTGEQGLALKTRCRHRGDSGWPEMAMNVVKHSSDVAL